MTTDVSVPPLASRPVRVLVVDDHPVVRDGLRGMLAGRSDLCVVGEAGDGESAVEQAARLRPDVVLMDLRMPRLDGVAATARITAADAAVRVLVLTTYDADDDIVRAIEAGAIGALLKDAPREELFRAVRAAVRREPVLPPAVAAAVLGRLHAPPQDTPTERELEVLTLVARGLTNRAIGRQLSISEATVKTHLVHLFPKLGVTDRTAAVAIALERRLIQLSGR